MSITAMKLALDALEKHKPKISEGSLAWITHDQAITALSAAIEATEKQEGWVLREVLFDEGEPIAHREPAQQEPVAIALNTGTKQGVKWLKNVEHGENLYTTPPAAQPAPVQEPVTEAQKRADFERFWVTEIGDKDDLTYGGLGYAINRVAVAWKAWKAAAQPALLQVSPTEFVDMVMDKEDAIGKPLFWAEWPNKEKNHE
jgi:hypothetical protein